MSEKMCELCTKPAIKGMRYCKNCKNGVLEDMRRDQYLTYVPKFGDSRTTEMKEDWQETKYGMDR